MVDQIPPNMIDAEGNATGTKTLGIDSNGQAAWVDRQILANGLFVTTPEANGAAGDGVTDDTGAFVTAMARIVAAGGGCLLLGAKTYLLNGSLDTSKFGNALVALPSDSRVPIQIIGVGPVNQCDPRIDTGYSIIKTTKTGLTRGANGVPSIIGGPTVDTHWVEDMVSIVNVCFWLPRNPTISAVDLRFVRRILWDGSTVVAINTGDADFVQPTSVYQFGLRTPDSANYNAVLVRNGAGSGCYVGWVGSAESTTGAYWSSKWCVLAWAPTAGGHAAQVGKISTEWCQYHVGGWSETAGVTSVPASHTGDTKVILAVSDLDIEDAATAGSPWYATVTHIYDPSNKFYGKVQYNRTLAGIGPTTGLTVNGAANLVTDCLLAPTVPVPVAVQDEGSSLTSAATSVNFVGSGVTATNSGAAVTVTIPGATSSTGELLMQDGVTAPPVPIENEARSDWLYQG